MVQLKPTRCFNRIAFFLQANDPLKRIDEVNGVKIGIEWPAGSIRKYKDGYEKKMHADYGYIRGTEGEDGEEIDVYVGPNNSSDKVFKVTQLVKGSGAYDEDKYMLGYDSSNQARASYLEHMDPKQFGGIKEMSWQEFLKIVPLSQRVLNE